MEPAASVSAATPMPYEPAASCTGAPKLASRRRSERRGDEHGNGEASCTGHLRDNVREVAGLRRREPPASAAVFVR